MKTPTIEERSARPGPADAVARANMYGFLAAVFLGPPEPELLQSVSDGGLLEELILLSGEPLTARSGFLRFSASSVQDSETLKQEYMDLFAVPTGRYVFPFEDVYRGAVTDGAVEKKGPLLGPRAIAAMSLYRQAGAQMDPAFKELPTHIGTELSFMSFLCQQEAQAPCEQATRASHPCPGGKSEGGLNAVRKIQLVFLTEHLNEWFPQLSRAIQANAKSQFYRILALLAERFLSWDTACLLDSPDLAVE